MWSIQTAAGHWLGAAAAMLDDFLTRAVLGGIGVALVAGPLGCFVVWRRLAYFGDTMAHSALLGVALAFLGGIDVTLMVFVVAVLVALALVGLMRGGILASDSLLGILAHSSLGLGLVLIALMTWLRVDLLSYLFGDILAVGRTDLAVIWLGGAGVLGVLALIWRPLLADTVSPELARADGLPAGPARLAYMVLLAAVIAVAIKIVGMLLVTAMLIIPAATARRLSGGPVAMAILASVCGSAAVLGGLGASWHLDTPAGPSIVVAAFVLFLAVQVVPLGGAVRPH